MQEAATPQGFTRVAWKDVADVPQDVFGNVAYAMRQVDEGQTRISFRQDEARAVLCLLREFVPSVGDYLDGA